MTEESVESRLGKLEAHMEHVRGDVGELRDDVRELLARPSALGELGAFVRAHWVKLLVAALTLTGAGWAAPILAAFK